MASLILYIVFQGNPGSDGPPGRDGSAGIKVGNIMFMHHRAIINALSMFYAC